MAVVDIREGWRGVRAGGDAESRSASRHWSIVTDSAADGPVFSWPLTAGGVTIPAKGTPHPDDSGLSSSQPQVTKVSPTFFNVRVDYGNVPTYEDPLTKPAEHSWSSVVSVEPTDVDALGDPILNAAGEPFDPPPTEGVRDPILTIVRNEAGFDPDTMLTYCDTVCLEPFWGASVGRTRMADIHADKVLADPSYWRVRYEVQFRMRTAEDCPDVWAWYRRMLNQGFRHLDDGGAVHAAVDADGQPVSQPVLLDGDGKLLNGTGRLDPDGEAPVWLYSPRFPEESWIALGINNT